VRQVGAGIGDAVDIEEDRAGNVAGEVVRLCVARGIGHVPAAIEHHDIGVAKMGGQPVGGDEWIVHDASSGIALWYAARGRDRKC
jgi:hypothetical protein